MKNIMLFTLASLSVSTLFAHNSPKLDLRKQPQSSTYNLYNSGCTGAELLIPDNFRVNVIAERQASCILGELPQLIQNGYSLELESNLQEDDGSCLVELINSATQKRTRLYKLSCNPT